MEIELVNKIKRLTIIALASDDDLIETIVLKGGNAIDLLCKSSIGSLPRISYDLDFSVENEFFSNEKAIKKRIEKTLYTTFEEHGYVMIDYKFYHKPHKRNEATETFWGDTLLPLKC